MNWGDAFRLSVEALRANKIRTLLTALGLIIGNASVILVVTISLTSRDYILDQIRAIGSNMVYAYYEGSQSATNVEADFVKMADVEAVREQLGGRIVAATGVMTNYDQIVIQGEESDVKVIGTDEHYAPVRNHVLLAGHFLDASDVTLRQKVALLTEELAEQLFGGQESAVGQNIKVHGLQFTVVGTFRERTSTYGLAELSDKTIVIPISVIRYFTPVERIDPMYVQAASAADVPAVTAEVREILEGRHRAGASFEVDNLTAILEAAEQIALVLSLALFMVAAVTLTISGVGIMNIMLVTVTERTREIGLRKAVGAPRRAILEQFLFEAMLISIGGGFLGILAGMAVPLSVRYFVQGMDIPLSWAAVVVAFFVSFVVGIGFGMWPATRASRLEPTEALRYE